MRIKWSGMQEVEDIVRRLIEITEVKLTGGWRGWIAVREGGKERFSKEEWETLLAEPEKLAEGAQQTLKSDGANAVMVKYLATGGRGVKAVMKRHRRGWGLRELLRSLGAARAIRNFIAAVKMRQAGLPAASPLAAVYRRKFLLCKESIYISEYVEGVNLHEFLRRMPRDPKERYWTMRELSEQISEIFAELHKRGLWHRDAKATNFIVSGDETENYKVVLTDMDGIKSCSVRDRNKQMRGLWRLAASVMPLGIYRTDYLRVFTAYCEKVGLPSEERAGLLRELSRKAQVKSRRV